MGSSKRALLAAATSALLLFGIGSVEAKAVTAPELGSTSTALDSAIDKMVEYRVSRDMLSPAEALVAREQMQMQFLSLSKADQQKVLDAASNLSSPEAVGKAILTLNKAVADGARQALADVQAANSKQQSGGVQPKLGGLDPDLVFVATVGPCRVLDTRFWFGQIASGQAQQIYVWSSGVGYLWSNQGGTGAAGSGNCTGDVFPGVNPVAVVATVSVVNTTGTGALQAWNGGTTLSGGAVLNWTAGERLSNTTVIQTDRTIMPFPGSGLKRDIAINNNSTGFTDVVMDVIGYFIMNTATALDCTRILDTDFSLAAGSTILRDAPACPTGYTPIVAMPATNIFGVYTGSFFESQCRINNTTGATATNLRCDAQCCRVPGR